MSLLAVIVPAAIALVAGVVIISHMHPWSAMSQFFTTLCAAGLIGLLAALAAALLAGGYATMRHDAAPTVTHSSTRLDTTNRPTKQDFINSMHTMILYAALRVELNPPQASCQWVKPLCHISLGRSAWKRMNEILGRF